MREKCFVAMEARLLRVCMIEMAPLYIKIFKLSLRRFSGEAN